MTPRKVRSVANLVKGLPVAEAEAQLLNIRLRAAVPLLKLLRSAVNNLKNNKHMSEEKFFIESFRVDGGPMLKRGLPRARGMMSPIQKKMSHVTLVIAENPNAQPSRFTITVTKKSKQPPEEEKPTKKERVTKSEKSDETRARKPSFFKRMFNRKAGFAK